MTTADPWTVLRSFTEARIGLGRSGHSLPTREVLKFSMAHARARDAVTTAIDWSPVETGLEALGLESMRIESAAPDRDTYLRRPDLGRRLSPHHGRSSAPSPAAFANRSPDRRRRWPILDRRDAQCGADNRGSHAFRPQAWLEPGSSAARHPGSRRPRRRSRRVPRRPRGLDAHRRAAGLTSPDSLGAYLTWEPRVGRKDGERNCISNIRAGGLGAEEAAFKTAWLLREAFLRRLTGVQLKDESNYQLEGKDELPALSTGNP